MSIVNARKKNVNRAKKELNEVMDIQINIESLKDQIIEMGTQIEGGAIQYCDKVQSSSEGKEALMCKYVDGKNVLMSLMAKKFDKLIKCNSTIEKINNERYQQVLRLKYMQGMTLHDISKQMKYSKRQIERYHGSALIAYEELISE